MKLATPLAKEQGHESVPVHEFSVMTEMFATPDLKAIYLFLLPNTPTRLTKSVTN